MPRNRLILANVFRFTKSSPKCNVLQPHGLHQNFELLLFSCDIPWQEIHEGQEAHHNNSHEVAVLQADGEEDALGLHPDTSNGFHFFPNRMVGHHLKECKVNRSEFCSFSAVRCIYTRNVLLHPPWINFLKHLYFPTNPSLAIPTAEFAFPILYLK